jgi:hypothetical protein
MATDFTSKDLKHYPHFDRRIGIEEIEEIVSDPDRVAKNKFYPFFLYHETWQPFRTARGGRPEKKSRPIRYAGRRDAYILTHYRRILAEKYEARLLELGIQDCPIAYRKIPKKGGGGKCNIDFAKDAFDEIDKQGNCVAVALDIKGYFENLDHSLIKKIWCDLLGVESLPKDHYSVFKNMTRYHVVDQKKSLPPPRIYRNHNRERALTRHLPSAIQKHAHPALLPRRISEKDLWGRPRATKSCSVKFGRAWKAS